MVLQSTGGIGTGSSGDRHRRDPVPDHLLAAVKRFGGSVDKIVLDSAGMGAARFKFPSVDAANRFKETFGFKNKIKAKQIGKDKTLRVRLIVNEREWGKTAPGARLTERKSGLGRKRGL